MYLHLKDNRIFFSMPMHIFKQRGFRKGLKKTFIQSGKTFPSTELEASETTCFSFSLLHFHPSLGGFRTSREAESYNPLSGSQGRIRCVAITFKSRPLLSTSLSSIKQPNRFCSWRIYSGSQSIPFYTEITP